MLQLMRYHHQEIVPNGKIVLLFSSTLFFYLNKVKMWNDTNNSTASATNDLRQVENNKSACILKLHVSLSSTLVNMLFFNDFIRDQKEMSGKAFCFYKFFIQTNLSSRVLERANYDGPQATWIVNS